MFFVGYQLFVSFLIIGPFVVLGFTVGLIRRWTACGSPYVQHTATRCNTLQHTLQHTATHCNALQHTATHCSTLQHTATYCNTLRHTATHCNTLQHTATHCNTLQHTATHCTMTRTSHDSWGRKLYAETPMWNTLYLTATHCNTLQHTATHHMRQNALRGSLEGAFYRRDRFDRLENFFFLYDSLGGKLYLEAPLAKFATDETCHMHVTH